MLARLSHSVGSEESSTDDALVREALADPAAFDALYGRYQQRVYAYLRARVASQEDTADLTQQVFLRALSGLPRYRGRGHQFAAWLFRIAHNVAADAHRQQRPSVGWDRLPGSLEPVEEGSLEAVAERREQLARLREAVLALDDSRRELLALRYAADLTASEIAVIVGTTEGAVRKRLSRTLRELKGAMDGP